MKAPFIRPIIVAWELERRRLLLVHRETRLKYGRKSDECKRLRRLIFFAAQFALGVGPTHNGE